MDLCGRLIGRQGVHVDYIRQKTQVDLVVRDDSVPSDKQVVALHGSSRSLARRKASSATFSFRSTGRRRTSDRTDRSTISTGALFSSHVQTGEQEDYSSATWSRTSSDSTNCRSSKTFLFSLRPNETISSALLTRWIADGRLSHQCRFMQSYFRSTNFASIVRGISAIR